VKNSGTHQELLLWIFLDGWPSYINGTTTYPRSHDRKGNTLMSFPKKAHKPIMQITNSSVGPMEQKYIEWTFLKLPNVGYLPCSEYRLIQNIDVRIVILFKRKKIIINTGRQIQKIHALQNNTGRMIRRQKIHA
jgi:hypothetical protein